MSALTVDAVHERDYQALVGGAALQMRPNFGVLGLTNRDRVDFLQRITTNDMARLHAGQAAVTVLTSPMARIEAVFTIMCRRDELLLLASEGQADGLRQRLQGQIFFMDKVTVSDVSGGLRRMRLLGPAAGALLLGAGLPQPEVDHSFLETEEGMILRQERFDLPGYEIIVTNEKLAAVQERLLNAGAVRLADDAAYELCRIAMGCPRPGKELTDSYNPLEVGMTWVCAENKGCYTGQEIIARQLTYDKVTKSLVYLHSHVQLAEGAPVIANNRAVGTVTSSVYHPTAGPLALAIVKRPYNVDNADVSVEGQAARVAYIPTT